MSIKLGSNEYGKSEVHLVRVYRDTDRHEIHDLTVSTSLRGDFTAAHSHGDQAAVLPTDTQKNTVFSYAREKGVQSPEQFALDLADHFLEASPAADGAKIEVVQEPWERIQVDGQGHDHSFVQSGSGKRNTIVQVDGRGADRQAHVVSGLSDLVVLKTAGSEFVGFLKDQYTILKEDTERILATSLIARWRYVGTDVDWNKTYDGIKALLLQRFAEVYSKALQQSLYAMGESVLEQFPQVAEIKFSAPNKHHFLVDLSPFGVDNPNEVFYAADRPYGLIEATVVRDDAADAGNAWHSVPGFC